MQKARIGISVGLMGLIIYFGGYFGGYFIAIILMGYVMLFEENPWLRRTSVKSLLLLVMFSVISELVNFIPDMVNIIQTSLAMFDKSLSTIRLTYIMNIINYAIGITKSVFFLILGFKSLNQGTVSVPMVDDALNKNVT